MAIQLNVKVRLSSTERKFIRLDNLATNMKVSELKKEITSKAGLESQASLGNIYIDEFIDALLVNIS